MLYAYSSIFDYARIQSNKLVSEKKIAHCAHTISQSCFVFISILFFVAFHFRQTNDIIILNNKFNKKQTLAELFTKNE